MVRDSSGVKGTGETPLERKRRGGSPPARRKASALRGDQPDVLLISNNLGLISQFSI